MDDKDRRSRMPTSSVNAPAKKDGAGGAYTWGSAADVTDYEPVGLGGMTKIATAPANPAAAEADPAAMAGGARERPKVQDPKQFPALGSASAVAAPATTVAWGPASAAKIHTVPTVVQAPPVYVTPQKARRKVAQTSPTANGASAPPLSVRSVTVTITEEEWQLVLEHRKARAASAVGAEQPPVAKELALAVTESSPVAQTASAVPVNVQEAMRTGVTFDAQHPRHIFARKPHTIGEAAAKQEIVLQPTIDWSGSGNLAFQAEMVHAAAQNPAHLAVHAAPRPGPSLEQLKARPSPAAYVPSKQQIVSAGPKFGKPQVIMQRKC